MNSNKYSVLLIDLLSLIYCLDFAMAAPELKSSKWMGPVIKMSLPSFR